jgi:hypothetical protein
MNFKLGPVGPQIMAQVTSDVDESIFEEPKVANQTLAEKEKPTMKLHKKHKATMQGRPVTACASTVMTMDIAKDMFLVGDVFMRKFYTVFDRENNRVGLAPAITNDLLRQQN